MTVRTGKARKTYDRNLGIAWSIVDYGVFRDGGFESAGRRVELAVGSVRLLLPGRAPVVLWNSENPSRSGRTLAEFLWKAREAR